MPSLRQVANDREALLSATLRLKQAQTELDTYRRYTAPKTIVALKADVEKARKWFIHEAGDFEKSKVQLAYYRSLVERCTIRAPHDGFVIYANGPFREDAERTRIEPGASVRQGQELFYFPDLSKMEVVAMLNEAVVDRVRQRDAGTGTLRRLARGGPGRASRIGGEPPEKERERCAVLSLPDRTRIDPSGLLPGMSAEVEVQVGRCRDVLAVPTEAVSVDHDRNVCYVIGPSGLERREITRGGSTPELIEVTDGLNEGESVVLNPTRVIDHSACAPSQPTWISPKRRQSPRSVDRVWGCRSD